MPTARVIEAVDELEDGRLSLSQTELAEFVGATREAVSKTLSQWKRSDVIDIGRGSMTILDRKALMLLADPDIG